MDVGRCIGWITLASQKQIFKDVKFLGVNTGMVELHYHL